MILGLAGSKGSGKDTVCSTISSILDRVPGSPGVYRIGLADPLKESIAALFGVCPERIEELKNTRLKRVWFFDGWRIRRANMRTILQRGGTEAGRDVYGVDFWINLSIPENLDHKGKLIVITDLRFENEAKRIIQLGGMVVGVYGNESSHDAHGSEALEWLDWYAGWWIDNSYRGHDSHDVLRQRVRRLASYIMRRVIDEQTIPVSETGTDV